jgi:hypothetical protein
VKTFISAMYGLKHIPDRSCSHNLLQEWQTGLVFRDPSRLFPCVTEIFLSEFTLLDLELDVDISGIETLCNWYVFMRARSTPLQKLHVWSVGDATDLDREILEEQGILVTRPGLDNS